MVPGKAAVVCSPTRSICLLDIVISIAARKVKVALRILEIGSCTELAREVGTRGIRTPRGNRIDKKFIYPFLPGAIRSAAASMISTLSISGS